MFRQNRFRLTGQLQPHFLMIIFPTRISRRFLTQKVKIYIIKISRPKFCSWALLSGLWGRPERVSFENFLVDCHSLTSTPSPLHYHNLRCGVDITKTASSFTINVLICCRCSHVLVERRETVSNRTSKISADV